MTYPLLKGMRVVEGAAFIAGPSCGLYLAQMGAEVIRFDNIGGGPDFRRWPLGGNGASLYSVSYTHLTLPTKRIV